MICLTMIVRNEAHVIRRSLLSALALVDCVCVCDTGSEDGTPELVCDLLAQSPRKVYVGSHAWVDFGTNRTRALRTAEDKFDLGPQDYHLILDADDVLDGGFEHGVKLDQDCYHLKVQDGSTVYHRAHLLRADGLWEYRSPVHEAPYRMGGLEATVGQLDWPVYHRIGGGARSKDPEKFLKDAALLEKALRDDPESDLVPRWRFYLAQSYMDAGIFDEAARAYRMRFFCTDGWRQEKYVAALRLASLGYTPEFWLRRAIETDPSRAEAPFAMAALWVQSNKPLDALLWATYAASLTPPEGALFSEPEVYEWAKNLRTQMLEKVSA